ncbi:MAG TPA: hypothetical protein VND22_02805 [Actinomycetota bacterium]|nr:hypothetical protein [Actinomycetota bacterium]
MDGPEESSHDWFDLAHGFSGDEGAWDRLHEAHESVFDLDFEIECGGDRHMAQMTRSGVRLSHSGLELEQALNALGGAAPECLRVHQIVEYVRRGEWESKQDWTFMLYSDSELQAIVASAWSSSLGTVSYRVSGVDDSVTLQDLQLLPEAARRRLAVTMVMNLMGNSSPLFRDRAARVCLRLLDPDFQRDPTFESALSIVRAMIIEERPQS